MSSVITCQSLSKGENFFDLFGIMTVFKVFHQYLADKVADFSLFAMCSLDLIIESLIILMTEFLSALNLFQ